ncbi:Helicase PriA essential for oriC/DnaA-independent DNA replication, partial [hydrothermal vent metagenome]
MTKNVAQVVFGLAVEGPFDYAVPYNQKELIGIGKRVSVLFNRHKRMGFVVGFIERSKFKQLNPILDVLDEGAPSINEKAVELTRLLHQHCGCTWGEALETYLPAGLRKGKKLDLKNVLKEKFLNKTGKTTLIHQGEGLKTWEVLVKEIKKTLDLNQSVIVLVPETELLDFVSEKIKKEISASLFILGKKSTAKKDLEIWQNIREQKGSIVIGLRSAIFSPVQDLGLIIVREEENSAYRQEQTPHYHVSDIAHFRKKTEQCNLVFTSAAPLAETWYEAQEKKWEIMDFSSNNTKFQLVDMTNYNPAKSSIVSVPLQNRIQDDLQNNKKIILFMNRRGFFTFTRCSQCEHVLKCSRCSKNLTYLASKDSLVCSRCNTSQELPKVCPNCRGSYLRSSGMGVEKLKDTLKKFYPFAKVLTLDKDTKVLPKFFDILVATQAVVKYYERLKVPTVAVMNFDGELNYFDFRSGQRAFTLLVHLRNMAQENFVVQTRMRDNYCLS